MHLVYKVLDNYPLPINLPMELLPSSAAPEVNNRKESTVSGALSVIPSTVNKSLETVKVFKNL